MLQVYWSLHQSEMGSLRRYKNCTYFLVSVENKKVKRLKLNQKICPVCTALELLLIFCLFSSVQGKEMEEVTTLN